MKLASFIAYLIICVFISNSFSFPSNLIRSKVSQEIINKKAPGFHLKDLNGKSVSLEDYRGKVLVLDFWATWCVPCRESFPVIREVMNKYKNDPKVAFLFIDTKERGKDYPGLVKNFMEHTGYPFHVAFDEIGKDGKMDVIFKKYNMPGIPSKYFIDSKGIIRFNMLGFDTKQSPEEAINELVKTIEMTKRM